MHRGQRPKRLTSSQEKCGVVMAVLDIMQKSAREKMDWSKSPPKHENLSWPNDNQRNMPNSHNTTAHQHKGASITKYSKAIQIHKEYVKTYSQTQLGL
jgi:hypothetical protein